MIYFPLRTASSKETIVLLLQFSPVSQSSGIASQAHVCLSALFPVVLGPRLRGENGEKRANELISSASIWEVIEGQRKESPYK